MIVLFPAIALAEGPTGLWLEVSGSRVFRYEADGRCGLTFEEAFLQPCRVDGGHIASDGWSLPYRVKNGRLKQGDVEYLRVDGELDPALLVGSWSRSEVWINDTFDPKLGSFKTWEQHRWTFVADGSMVHVRHQGQGEPPKQLGPPAAEEVGTWAREGLSLKLSWTNGFNPANWEAWKPYGYSDITVSDGSRLWHRSHIWTRSP